MPPPTGCRIVEVYTGVKNSARFEAYCGDDLPRPHGEAGSINIFRAQDMFQGRVGWLVGGIFVNPKHRRRGIATVLYEAAAAFACKRRGRLVSARRDTNALSNEFWYKQERRGRARSYFRRGYSQRVYVLDVCGQNPIDLSGLPSKRSR